jgi:predicted ABC-class ATPase
MIEKRRHPRQRVLKRGMLTFIGGGDCTVRNISISGARVDVASPLGIPDQFHLVIEADQFIRRGRPVWNSERQIGIAFD